MNILVAMDKFKGSMTALVAGHAVECSLRKVVPQASVRVIGIADGGEGTVEALGGEKVSCQVLDAQGREITASYAWLPNDVAVMEMSAASGLALVSDLPLNPEMASTYGTGQLILHASQRGAKRIIIGIGGSATNDGGRGMAEALGFRFEGKAVTPPLSLHLPPIDVACDVDNPLLGPRGATSVYGPQKGVIDIATFESRMSQFARMVAEHLGHDLSEVPGAGAAGGLGFGLMAFCGAKLLSGFDLVADVIGLQELVRSANVVITGEGRLDEQSLMGKGPAGVAKMAKAAGARVMGIAGSIQAADKLSVLFDHLLQIKPESMPVAEAMALGPKLIEQAMAENEQELKKFFEVG
ncbi:MAG: glycerate kinase [Verrucomicrobiaceae bacterium]|nr:glycerate kinase [Verrucomicrobiaceae bacterium]